MLHVFRLPRNYLSALVQWPGYPWLVWGLGAAFFFTEYVARLAPNVMADALMAHFQVSAWGLGVLSAYFYWPNILMQLPVGVLVDQYGVKRILVAMTAICGFSCVLFSMTSSIGWAYFSRAIFGAASAFAFVATLKIATQWFPASRFGLLAGATQALGMIGAAFGEGPVAWLMAHLSWVASIQVMAMMFFSLSLLIALIFRNASREENAEAVPTCYRGLLAGLLVVLKNRQTWANAFFAALIFAPTGVFAELWGVTYLQHVDQLTHMQAAEAMSMVFLGWGIGGPLCGAWSDALKRRKPFMYGSALLSMLFLMLVLYVRFDHLSVLSVLLFLYGVANSGLVMAYALSGEINPQPVAGVSIAFANMASIVLAPVLQTLAGWLLDTHWDGVMAHGVRMYSVHAYHVSTYVLPVTLLLAFVVAFWVKETHCQRIEESQ